MHYIFTTKRTMLVTLKGTQPVFHAHLVFNSKRKVPFIIIKVNFPWKLHFQMFSVISLLNWRNSVLNLKQQFLHIALKLIFWSILTIVWKLFPFLYLILRILFIHINKHFLKLIIYTILMIIHFIYLKNFST